LTRASPEEGQTTVPNASTLAIVLGAGEFPQSKNFHANPAFRASAGTLLDYLTSPRGLGLTAGKLLDLFDSEKGADAQLGAIAEFLAANKQATDLLIYYVGHGGFLPNRNYYLAIRCTTDWREYITALEIDKIALAVQENFSKKRVRLILDCCFAGQAVRHFQSGALELAQANAAQAFPASGTALLVAAAKGDAAMAPQSQRYTKFSGALLSVLNDGIADAGERLSLAEVGKHVIDLLASTDGNRAARPEVHSPRQTQGDVAKVPFFPNPAATKSGSANPEGAAKPESSRKPEGPIGGVLPVPWLWLAPAIPAAVALFSGVAGVAWVIWWLLDGPRATTAPSSTISATAILNSSPSPPSANAIPRASAIPSSSPLTRSASAPRPIRAAPKLVALADVAPMRFVSLAGGRFQMGSPAGESGHTTDEKQHPAEVGAFEIAIQEVTQRQWVTVMRTKPFDCTDDCTDDKPAQKVSWFDATKFMNALTDRENRALPASDKRTRCYDEKTWTWERTCTGYRLPTEAEWEYAARDGTTTAYSFGSYTEDLCSYGNGADLKRGSSGWKVNDQCNDGYVNLAPVGSFRANRSGLFDMHGNVREWVWDWYGPYPETLRVAYVGPPGGNKRVLRGGSFVDVPWTLRSSDRIEGQPENGYEFVGFRCVRDAPLVIEHSFD
jgi:formylglycine-generating enzyme required for sulfatase activity